MERGKAAVSISKLSLVNIIGDMQSLDQVILCCLDRDDFHPERSLDYSGNIHGFAPLQGENPYAGLLSRLDVIGMQAGLAPVKLEDKQRNVPKGPLQMHECSQFCESFEKELSQLNEKEANLRGTVERDESALSQLEHIQQMDVDFDSLFTCKFLKMRIGRMPTDSLQKLAYYQDRKLLFLPLDRGRDFCWGIYFTLADYATEVDDIFSSLYFERIHIPGFVHGTSKEAFEKINEELEKDRIQLKQVEADKSKLLAERRERYEEIYLQALYHSRSFEMRSYVATLRRNFIDLFHITGFIEERNAAGFVKELGAFKDVMVEILPPGSDKRIKEPTKLRNNWFSKPFEMFVEMYGLPSYNDIDPTPFVAITYCLLFGIMFGDLGQGLVLILLGELLWKFKKMNLGRVMSRIGIFSSLFGILFGSVFGMEHVLDPLYHNLFGLAEKPIEVMAPSMTNVILVAAIALGVALILVSMCFNLVVAWRRRDIQRGLFSANGLAGILFYGSILVGAAMLMLGGINLFNPVYVVCLIVLPLLVILFNEPLGEIASGKSFKEAMPENGLGGYLMVGFFELFEVVLSFFSNTMSFLRVGGFVLSHAGMMAVVLTLTEMTGGGAVGIVVMVIGNLFVMAMEGLIVGIQVLRLEFYEMFSRYFDGDGKPFVAAGVQPVS